MENEELIAEIRQAGEYLNNLLSQVKDHINTKGASFGPDEYVPQSKRVADFLDAAPRTWLEMATNDFKVGMMKLKRAVEQPTDF